MAAFSKTYTLPDGSVTSTLTPALQAAYRYDVSTSIVEKAIIDIQKFSDLDIVINIDHRGWVSIQVEEM